MIERPVFVIGSDQFQNLDHWSKFPYFLKFCDWIVLLRRPSTMDSIHPMIQKLVQTQVLSSTSNQFEFLALGKKLKFISTDAMEVSSTWVREKLSLGDWESLKNVIPSKIQEYILRNKIYGK
jgi:nicotinic acid mononucleotide adenylyltransferase